MKNLKEIIELHEEWSLKTFGCGEFLKANINHIKEELDEVLAEETGSQEQLLEWCDVILLAFNGATRSGHSLEEVIEALAEKTDYNLHRTKVKMYKEDGTYETKHLEPCKGARMPISIRYDQLIASRDPYYLDVREILTQEFGEEKTSEFFSRILSEY